MPQLRIDFFRSGNGICNLVVEQLPVTLTQAVHGGLDRVLGCAERPGELGIGLRGAVANQARVNGGEELHLAVLLILVQQAVENFL